MSASDFDDKAMTSGSAVTSDVNRALRLNGTKTDSRYFRFPWKQRNKDDKSTTTGTNDNDFGSENLSSTKLSNGFLKNFKKRLRIQNISLRRTKQKIKAIDSQCPTEQVISQASTLERRPLSFAGVGDPIKLDSRLAFDDSDASSGKESNQVFHDPVANVRRESYAAWGNESGEGETAFSDGKTERKFSPGPAGLIDFSYDRESEEDSSVIGAGNAAEPSPTVAKESLQIQTGDGTNAGSSDDCKAKVNLSEELLKLSKYGWYWGPISGDEADSKLAGEPDGAFLVRDSSDDRYLLTLSFKSSGRLLHARMEHSGGLFSLCNQDGNEGFTSVAALIDHSMNSSQSAVFCYSRPRYPGYPSFPVRLTKPVSRFTQVRSLQYLCRFVIRQNTRFDNIHKLPLPKTIRGYIEEAHY